MLTRILSALMATVWLASGAAAQSTIYGTLSASSAPAVPGPLLVPVQCQAIMYGDGWLWDYLSVALYADSVEFASAYRASNWTIDLTIGGDVQVDRLNRDILCLATSGSSFMWATLTLPRRQPAGLEVLLDNLLYVGPGNYHRYRRYEVRDNYNRAYAYTDAALSEAFVEAGPNECELSAVVTGPPTTLNNEGRFEDNYYSGTQLPAKCQQVGSCTSSFTQVYEIDGFQIQQSITFTCSDVIVGG